MNEVGIRVMAIRNADAATVYSFGEGTYLGSLEPQPRPSWAWEGWTNPCIKLDDGSYVWGFECWWGPLERCQAEIVGTKQVVHVLSELGLTPKEQG